MIVACECIEPGRTEGSQRVRRQKGEVVYGRFGEKNVLKQVNNK